MSRVETLLNLAGEELLTAELLLKNDFYRASVSRCYYVLYYTIQALLSAKNITTRTHRGSIQQLGQHFIKTGDLPEELSRILAETFNLRQLSDRAITMKQSLSLDNKRKSHWTMLKYSALLDVV